jgi:hypothetical protein
MVVSCYADTSISSGVRSLWREHLRSEVKRIEEALTGDKTARTWLEQSVTAIKAALSSSRTRSARGIAIFAAVRRDLVHGYALTAPVGNRLVVDEEPYLMPLLELLNRQRRYLVVHTDTHRGRLYTRHGAKEPACGRRLRCSPHVTTSPCTLSQQDSASTSMAVWWHFSRATSPWAAPEPTLTAPLPEQHA